jgi:DNA-binding NarL/FixJ family response regulator
MTSRESPLRVYLVDDHALVRGAIRQAIEAPDIEVVGEASSGEQALDELLELRPDVVLLDINLPGIGGLQLVREISPRLPETKFVMLTVSKGRRDVLEAIRNGASGYLTKDLAPAALKRAIQGLRRGEMAMARRQIVQLVGDLVAAGQRPRTADEALAGLTEREHEILRLMAEGLTDREIGAALTISPRTVETHVSNVLHKLGVRNRAGAAQRYRAGI